MKHVITTTVTYTYESEDNEFASKKEAEEFGWNFDDMLYDSVYSIEVDEYENDEDEEEDE